MACHPLKRAWDNMRIRCLCPSHPYYAKYGGAGITIDSRWLVYENFAADMGPHPGPKYSLDRADNTKGYSKENCRWATAHEQRINQKPRRSATGIPGVILHKRLERWYVYTAYPQTLLGSSQNFFEACCIRKSWEIRK